MSVAQGNMAGLLLQIKISRFFLQMTVRDFSVGQLYRVMSECVAVLETLDDHESHRQQDGAGIEKLETSKLVHLTRGPGHHGRDARGNQHQGIERTERDIEPAVRPVTLL